MLRGSHERGLRMFGWIRKLTQRTAVEELTDSSPSVTTENAEENTPAQQVITPHVDVFARPVAQLARDEHMVDVYTPEPMPEPPTVDLPRPFIDDAAEYDGDSDFVSAHAASEQIDTPSHALSNAVADETVFAEAAFVDTDPAEADAEPLVAEPQVAELQAAEAEVAESTALDAQFDGLLAAPSPRPAMPLSAHPNFAGLGLAKWETIAPRLLEPEAALTPEAQEQLLKLFDDLFGPCGRYRLEWRTERHPGDDAMFAEIMTADLVRRVQNTIADVSELERPAPPKAIGRASIDRDESEDHPEDETFRRAS